MASTPIDIPVLIVGGGPAGLVLALTLAKNNVPVRVIEKNTTFHSSQRGSGIQPRSLELFKFLGVLPDVWAGSRYNTPSAIYKMPEGREVAKIVDMTPYVEPTPDVPFRTPRIIGQFHTEEILRSHLAQYNVIVETGTELVSFAQDEESVTAEILLKTGDTQEKKTIRAQYLVTAEGAKSIVRKQLGIPFQGETKDVMHLVLADVHVTGVSADYWHQWGDMGTKTVRIRPTEDPGVFSIMAGGKDADVASLAASREALFAFVYEVTKRSPNELQFGEIRSLSEFRPNIRLADKYSEGRVFLVGDAVHVHSPTGGQGLNTGIQDSFNLGWKLSLVIKHQAPPSLLTTYNTERRPVARDVLSMTSEIMNKTVAFKTGEEATFARRPQALHQLGVNYRLSDIVVDEQPALNDDQIFSAAYKPEDATVLRAGDRAPDAPGLLRIEAKGTNVSGLVGESIALFDVLKPTRHTALVFLGGSDNLAVIQETVKALKSAPQGALHVLFILPKDYESTLNALTSVVRERDCSAEDTEIVVDTQGYAHTFYPPATQGFPVIIVRPDAAVGAVVKGGEGVSRYFKLVFGTEH